MPYIQPCLPDTDICQYPTFVSTRHLSVPNICQYPTFVSTQHLSVPNTCQYPTLVSTQHLLVTYIWWPVKKKGFTVWKKCSNERVKTLPDLNIQFDVFAILPKRVENRRRTSVALTTLAPLNNTNLIRRPVCLKHILFPYLPPFQSFLLTNFKRQLLQIDNSNGSSQGKSDSLFFQIFHLKRVGECLNSWGESLKKDSIMKHLNIIEGEQGEFHSNFTNSHNFSSMVTSDQNLSNAKWAKIFIKENKLTNENFLKNTAYKNLPRGKRKKAVYDQLRNKALKNKVVQIGPQTNKKQSSLLSISLILPVIFSEIILVTASYGFYRVIGFNNVEAILSALSVELFFMLLASQKSFVLRASRFLVLTYSVFTVSYYSIETDERVRGEKILNQKELRALDNLIDTNQRKYQELLGINGALLRDKAIYQKHERVTQGQKLLESKFEKNSIAIENTVSELTRLQEQKLNLSRRSHSNGFMEKLSLAGVKTFALIGFYFVIQVLTAICSPQIFNSIRNISFKKKRRKALSSS